MPRLTIMKSICIFVACLCVTQLSFAQEYEAGKHYEVLPSPVMTYDKNKIEVVELFWYGCGHCFKFEPMVKGWKDKLAADVDFRAMPAMWNDTMKLHAKAFYVAKALGIFDKTHAPFFSAMHVKKQRFKDEGSIAKFFAAYGVDEKTFEKTIKSFGITSQVNLAESRARSYRMQGTPEIIVNGKYRVSSGMTGGQPQMLKVASYLIEQERKALAK